MKTSDLRFRLKTAGRSSFRGFIFPTLLVVAAAIFLAILGFANSKEQRSYGGPRLVAAKVTGDAKQGKELYIKDGCYECHGLVGQGGTAGPRLGPKPVPLEALIAYVRQPAGQMPPYTDKVLSDQDLENIHDFLETLPPPVSEFELLK
jgi:mono/diheme cytochrome c family protein